MHVVPDSGSREPDDDPDPQAQALAAYQWNVSYLSDCQVAAMELRDKAFFLGFNQLAGMLEAVRAESETILWAMIAAKAGSQTTAQSWADSLDRAVLPPAG